MASVKRKLRGSTLPKGPCRYIVYTWALERVYGNPSGPGLAEALDKVVLFILCVSRKSLLGRLQMRLASVTALSMNS